MAHVYGQIESLKQIRTILDAKGIDRFNSLHDFDLFLENYEIEKEAIYRDAEKELDTDIFILEEDIEYNCASIEKNENEGHKLLESKISDILRRSSIYEKRNESPFLSKQYSRLVLCFLSVIFHPYSLNLSKNMFIFTDNLNGFKNNGKLHIVLQELLSRVIEIEASSAEEAIDIARKMHRREKLVLSSV